MRNSFFALIFALAAFGLVACGGGGGGGGDGGGGGGGGGGNGNGNDDVACENPHSSGTCTGFTGTNFTLTDGTVNGDVTGGDEADAFTLNGGRVTGNVDGGGGGDMITLGGAGIDGNILGGGGGDTIMLTSGSEDDDGTAGKANWTGHVDGGADNDEITLSGGTWDSYSGGEAPEAPETPAERTVYGGGGSDMLILDGATIENDITGEDDSADIFTLNHGMVGGNVEGGSGADTITIGGADLSGAAVSGYLQYDGADTITLTSGSLAELRGTGGADEITLLGTGGTAAPGNVVIESSFTLDAIDMGVSASASDADTIEINGATVSGYLQYDGADIVTLTSGTLGELRGTEAADTIIIDGNVENAEGGTIKIHATDFTLGFIDLRGGNDSITLNTGTWAGYYGGAPACTDPEATPATCGEPLGAGVDNPFAGTATRLFGGGGKDMFTLASGATIGNIVGADFSPADTAAPTPAETADSQDVFILSGTVTGYVDAQGGDDAITLSDGEWDSYDGGAREANDTTATKVWGGGGEDTLILNGATITGGITGEDGEADIFTLNGGMVGGNVVGGSGNDVISLGSAGQTLTVTGYVDGGAGDDEITLSGGEWAAYNGGDGADVRTVYGGADTDTFILNGGAMITGNIIGESGVADTIEIDGADVMVSGHLQYDSADSVTLTSGTLNELLGTSNADVIVIDGEADAAGGTLKIADDFTLGSINLRDGDDSITLKTGTWATYRSDTNDITTAGRKIDTGTGDDTLILDGATITGLIIGESISTDVFMFMSGTVEAGARVNTGSGPDMITIDGAQVLGALQYNVTDTVRLTSGRLGELRGGGGAETITLVAHGSEAPGMVGVASGFTLDKIDMGVSERASHADTITIDGAEVSGYLQYDRRDVITLTSGSLGELRGTDEEEGVIIDDLTATAEARTVRVADAFTLGFINLRAGDDALTLKTGTWSAYSGGTGSTSGTVYGGPGADTFILDGATITGNIIGENNSNDVITLTSGTLGANTRVNGGSGDDTITLGFRTWNGYSGGNGGSASTVYGGGGVDTFILAGARINGDITGDGDADVITLTNGNVGTETTVNGGGGNDIITLGFETWANYFGFNGATSKTVYGGGGEDTFILDGAMAKITNHVTGEGNTDIITLRNGTIGGNITLGSGRDTLNLEGTVVMDGTSTLLTAPPTISGDGGDDTLNYRGGSILASAGGSERNDNNILNINGFFRSFQICTYDIAANNPGNVGTANPCTLAPASSPPVVGLEFQDFDVLTFSPELALAGVLPSALQDFTSAAASFLAVPQGDAPRGLWVREEETLAFGGGGMTLAARGLEGLEANGSYAVKMSLTQQGYNKPLTRTGAVVLRSFMHLAEGKVEAGDGTQGHADVQGYGAGFALLWSGDDVYVQAATLAAWHEADARYEGDVFSAKGEGFLVSIDAGRAYALRGGLTLRPQARVLWQSLFLDDFSQDNRRYVFGADERFEGRMGFALEGRGLEATAFMVHTGGDAASLTTGMRQDYHPDGLALEARLSGAMANVSGFAVSGDVTHRLSLEGRRNDFTASLSLSRRF